jgi:hypothetical protein
MNPKNVNSIAEQNKQKLPEEKISPKKRALFMKMLMWTTYQWSIKNDI